MAVKPSVNPESWGVPGNYLTGPFAGFSRQIVIPVGVANEGHRPGAAFPTAAEYWNYWLWTVGELSRWVFAGSFTPVAEANIVERDANGQVFLQRLDVESSADPLQTAVTIRGTEPGVAAVDIEPQDPSTIGLAIQGDGIPLFVNTSDAGGAPAVTIVNSGAGDGLTAVAGTGRGIATQANGTAPAIESLGSLTQPALATTSGSGTAPGIDALAGGPGATAIGARTDPGAAASSEAILAEGFADGVAVRAIAEDGPALELTGGGTVPALRLVGNISPAAGALDGDVEYVSGVDQFQGERGGERQAFWQSPSGSAYGTAVPSDYPLPGTNTLDTVKTVSLSGVRAPAQAGAVLDIEAGFIAQNDGGAGPWDSGAAEVELFDVTDGSTIVSFTGFPYLTDGTANSLGQTATICFPYSVPAAGPRDIALRINDGGANNIDLRNVYLRVRGSYD